MKSLVDWHHTAGPAVVVDWYKRHKAAQAGHSARCVRGPAQKRAGRRGGGAGKDGCVCVRVEDGVT